MSSQALEHTHMQWEDSELPAVKQTGKTDVTCHPGVVTRWKVSEWVLLMYFLFVCFYSWAIVMSKNTHSPLSLGSKVCVCVCLCHTDPLQSEGLSLKSCDHQGCVCVSMCSPHVITYQLFAHSVGHWLCCPNGKCLFLRSMMFTHEEEFISSSVWLQKYSNEP